MRYLHGVFRAVAAVSILMLPMRTGAETDFAAVERGETSRIAHASARRALVLRERRAYYGPLIQEAARAQGVRVDLVHAIIEVESAYRADAVSKAGAIGLMQLMPATARRYGVDDSSVPRQNLAGGTAYLRDLHALYEGNLPLVLAAYNAGEEAVARHGGRVPPYAETRDYVRRVVRILRRRSPILAISRELPSRAPLAPEGIPAWTR
ncbi:MAG: lytic transglycosylase domain-containing protein [Gemmatimonadetes bacterium]|nr:lytic transglycosylase domain-containing protein [Gemmatimonadota bacterium]